MENKYTQRHGKRGLNTERKDDSMARSFLKVYLDFDERTDELSDNEKGRLLLAMYRYAKTGQKPVLNGNERFLFSAFKGDIDRDIAAYNTKVANGNMGGRPSNEKPKETENNLTKPNETEDNLNLKNKNKKKNEDIRVSKETQNAHAKAFETFWAAYPRHTGKQNAQKAFDKLKPNDDLLEIMLSSINAWKLSDQWTKDGGQYIPHPATWLNGRRWEDELPKAAGLNMKQTGATQYQQRDYTEDELEPDWVKDLRNGVTA